MARLLTQLFEVTAQFNMQTQPQLLLLQKTMVVVEGVARTLNPDLNMWVTAEPVVRGWIERKLGPVGRIEDGVNGPGPDGHESPRHVRRRGKGHARCCPTWRSRADCGSTVKRPKRWPWPRHGATGRCAMPLVIGAAALVAIAIALFRL